MAIELATAYVSIVPSERGLGKSIIKDMQGDLDNESTKAGTKSGKKFGEGFVPALGKAGLAGGLALGAAVIKGSIDAISNEKDLDLLAASLGLTEGDAARVGDVAKDLYGNAYGGSVSEAGDAVQGLLTNVTELGDVTNSELSAMGAKALDLSAILDEDVSRATRGVGQLMRNGLAVDADEAFDLITTAAQKLPKEMRGELLDTIEEYGSTFEELGFTGEQALAAMTNGVDEGARNIDFIADAFKELSIRAIDGSDLTSEAFDLLGLNAGEMSQAIANGGPAAAAATSEIIQSLGNVGDAALQEQIGVALFGTKFEDLGADVIAAMDPAKASLGDFAGSAAAAGDTLNDNLSTRIETVKRKGFLALAKAAERWVLPALEGIIGVVEQVTTAFGEGGLSGVIELARSKMQPLFNFLETYAPILIGVAGVIGVILVAAFISWATAAGAAAIATITAMAPVLAVAAAVGLLAAGLVYAYQHSDRFRAIVDAVAGFIKNKLVPALIEGVSWLAGKIGPAIGWVADMFKTRLLPAIKTSITWLGKIASKAISIVRTVKTQFTGMIDTVKGLPGKITSAATGMWDGIKTTFASMVNGIASLWNNGPGALGFTIPSWVPKIGGSSFEMPDIPVFHEGGIVPGRPGEEVLILAMAGERVIDAASTASGDYGSKPEGGGDTVFNFVNSARSPFDDVHDALAGVA